MDNLSTFCENIGVKSKLNIGKMWINTYVKKAEITPCKNFPIIYGFIDILAFEVILNTWRIILNPPKPKTKDENTIIVERFLEGIWVSIFNPLVSSIKPQNIGLIKFVLILSMSKTGYNIFEAMFNNPELFNIEIITENRITKPPIITTVLMAFIILLDKTSPKFAKVTILLLLLVGIYKLVLLSLYFQNLNNIPTIIHAKIWVIKRSIPY